MEHVEEPAAAPSKSLSLEQQHHVAFGLALAIYRRARSSRPGAGGAAVTDRAVAEEIQRWRLALAPPLAARAAARDDDALADFAAAEDAVSARDSSAPPPPRPPAAAARAAKALGCLAWVNWRDDEAAGSRFRAAASTLAAGGPAAAAAVASTLASALVGAAVEHPGDEGADLLRHALITVAAGAETRSAATSA